MRSSIIELITLTKQNLNSLNHDIKDDPFAKEYELFQVIFYTLLYVIHGCFINTEFILQAELQNESSNSTNDLQVADTNIQVALNI